jgi:hypothetical protein
LRYQILKMEICHIIVRDYVTVTCDPNQILLLALTKFRSCKNDVSKSPTDRIENGIAVMASSSDANAGRVLLSL